MFYYAFGQLGTGIESTQKDSLQTEIETFNTSFEAYNKKAMYGVDVITVLHKAIDNNKKYDIEFYNEKNENRDYFVDVIVKFTDYNHRTGLFDENKPKDTYSLKKDYKENGTGEINKLLAMAVAKNIDDYDKTYIYSFKFSNFSCVKTNYVKKGSKVEPLAVGRISELEFDGDIVVVDIYNLFKK